MESMIYWMCSPLHFQYII